MVPQAKYWRVRVKHLAGGKPVDEYQDILKLYPQTFYGLLAQERLRELGAKPEPIFTERPKLSSKVAVAPELALPRALASAGLWRESAEELRARLGAVHTPDGALRVGTALARVGEAWAAYHLANRLLWGKAYAQKDPAALALLYPRPYVSHVDETARAQGIHASLLYAIMRRESAFQPDRLSAARARGLMQLMARTASAIAKELQRDPPEPDELYRPELNLDLSAWYVGQLSKRFVHPVLISAAYNAGPVVTLKWTGELGSMPVDLVRRVDALQGDPGVREAGRGGRLPVPDVLRRHRGAPAGDDAAAAGVERDRILTAWNRPGRTFPKRTRWTGKSLVHFAELDKQVSCLSTAFRRESGDEPARPSGTRYGPGASRFAQAGRNQRATARPPSRRCSSWAERLRPVSQTSIGSGSSATMCRPRSSAPMPSRRRKATRSSASPGVWNRSSSSHSKPVMRAGDLAYATAISAATRAFFARSATLARSVLPPVASTSRERRKGVTALPGDALPLRLGLGGHERPVHLVPVQRHLGRRRDGEENCLLQPEPVALGVERLGGELGRVGPVLEREPRPVRVEGGELADSRNPGRGSPSASSASSVRGRSSTLFAPVQTTIPGYRASAPRSAEMSPASPRCTPPMPPVAKMGRPHSAATAQVALTVVPPVARWSTAEARSPDPDLPPPVRALRQPPDLVGGQPAADRAVDDRHHRRDRPGPPHRLLAGPGGLEVHRMGQALGDDRRLEHDDGSAARAGLRDLVGERDLHQLGRSARSTPCISSSSSGRPSRPMATALTLSSSISTEAPFRHSVVWAAPSTSFPVMRPSSQASTSSQRFSWIASPSGWVSNGARTRKVSGSISPRR